eukprot:1158273-Pelagomonas_calceolata.AAC.10
MEGSTSPSPDLYVPLTFNVPSHSRACVQRAKAARAQMQRHAPEPGRGICGNTVRLNIMHLNLAGACEVPSCMLVRRAGADLGAGRKPLDQGSLELSLAQLCGPPLCRQERKGCRGWCTGLQRYWRWSGCG